MNYIYICNACGADESLKQYRRSHVCPWCGEGVMQFENEIEESEENDE